MPKYRIIISVDDYVKYEDVEKYISELFTGLTINWEDILILGFGGKEKEDIAHRFASENAIEVKDFQADIEQFGPIDAYSVRFNAMLDYAISDGCAGMLFIFHKKYNNHKQEAIRAAKRYGLQVFTVGV